MSSAKRNPLWHLWRLDLRLRGRTTGADLALGPWWSWFSPADPLVARVLHVERRECGDGRGEDVLCTAGHARAALDAIGCPP